MTVISSSPENIFFLSSLIVTISSSSSSCCVARFCLTDVSTLVLLGDGSLVCAVEVRFGDEDLAVGTMGDFEVVSKVVFPSAFLIKSKN